MADAYAQILPNSTGEKIDLTELSVAGNTVGRQRINVADPTDASGLQGVVQTSAMEALTSAAYGALANVPMIKDMAEAVKQMARIMGRNLSMITDPSSGKLRVSFVDLITSVSAVSSVSAVTTLNNLNSQSIQFTLMYSTDRAEWALNVRSRIS